MGRRTMMIYTLLSALIAAFAWVFLRVKNSKLDDQKHLVGGGAEWQALLLVDGDCALCNGFVQFVIFFNTSGTGRFATQQSPFGQRMLRENNQPMDLSTMVMMERVPGTDKADCYVKSTGVLRTMKFLDAPANALGAALAIPVWFRDPCYAAVAKWRYVLFGNTEIKLRQERNTLETLGSRAVPAVSAQKRFICPHCSQKYAREHGLKVHMLCHGVSS